MWLRDSVSIWGYPTVLTLHTMGLSVLVEVSDRLAIMYAGKIVEEGKADRIADLLEEAADEIERLMSKSNINLDLMG